jgi:peroxiredoxin
MTQSGTRKLDAGDPVPAMELATVGGGAIGLPDAFGAGWGVLLFYRGHF